MTDPSIQLAVIVALGVGCQWLANRLRVPSILLLLAAGIVAGPALDIVHPDELFGELLFPVISLGVGVLLFEGGMALRRDEIRDVGHPLVRLVTVGVLITWLVGAISARFLFDLDTGQALLAGAILVVSGPTVVLPLLRLVNVRPSSASLLRWEAILIDPIGALLAIVVVDAMLGSDSVDAIVGRIVLALGGGALVGAVAAVVVVEGLSRHWIPDRLHTTVTLATVLGTFVVANQIQAEAGLTATTIMGIVLANQRRAPAAHIAEFGEAVSVLVLGSLFVVLGARVDLQALTDHFVPSLVLLAVLVLVARPLAVWGSTLGTELLAADRRFVASLAPRGIVAAAVASLFALELEDHGTPFPELVPVVITVMLGSVIIYGIAGPVLAKRFGVVRAAPRGVILLGASPWVVDIADRLLDLDVPCLVVTSDTARARAASRRSIPTFVGRMDSEELTEAAEHIGAVVVLALDESGEANDLGSRRLSEVVGRAGIFRLREQPDEVGDKGSATTIRPQPAFGGSVVRSDIRRALAQGGRVATLTSAYDPEPGTIPLVVVGPRGTPRVARDGERIDPGEQVIAITPRRSPRRWLFRHGELGGERSGSEQAT